MTRPFLSMTLIAKNEADNIHRCFSSWWDAVDEVVLVDTGSTDTTIKKAREFARKHGNPDKLRIGTVEWTDDFAAARQAADDLATGTWVTWCDLDDTIQGLDRLRDLAKQADEQVVAFFTRYDYARDPSGNSISELWRERMVRHDGTRWEGRLHEHKIFRHGAVVKVGPETAHWIHHRDHEHRTGERNLRILEQWDRDEPDNPRIVSSLALEYMGAERHKQASDAFARFLALAEGEPPERRCQAVRHLCVMLLLQGRVDEARQAAFNSLVENWLWADTHLTLAEVEQTIGHPEVAIRHAKTALELGKPDTLLIVNPLQYTAHPRALMAVCLAQLGRFEEAVAMAEEALQIAPTYSLAADHVPLWRGQLKKQHTLQAFSACADVLVETGEVLKARELLSQAPYFIEHEPGLIQRRVQVAALVAERLGSPPAPVADEAADAFVLRHLEAA